MFWKRKSDNQGNHQITVEWTEPDTGQMCAIKSSSLTSADSIAKSKKAAQKKDVRIRDGLPVRRFWRF